MGGTLNDFHRGLSYWAKPPSPHPQGRSGTPLTNTRKLKNGTGYSINPKMTKLHATELSFCKWNAYREGWVGEEGLAWFRHLQTKDPVSNKAKGRLTPKMVLWPPHTQECVCSSSYSYTWTHTQEKKGGKEGRQSPDRTLWKEKEWGRLKNRKEKEINEIYWFWVIRNKQVLQ